ncbi:hypothetical protein PWP93_16975 [Paraburkholderia sp. A1RI-2L]|uniref:FimV/HubP family polar landmark protein n=1 Tax=Paraburkholderia sp. A1RI-2L TaxID=3028367 RepID=UPI003B7B0F38
MRRTAVAVSAALLVAMAGASGMVHAQSGAAAAAATSGAAGASAPAAALPIVGQYTIHPGQSLHDVAVDVTQSHDKAVIARASQALFDANPSAFMKRDPSRLKVGAVLNVPGTPDMASAAAGASAPAVAGAASAPGASAAIVAGASSAAEAAAPASTTTAVATGASASTNAGAMATSGAAGASAPAASASVASAPAVSAASAEASASAVPAPASDPHSWSGAVQAAPPAAAASAIPGSAASTPKVSSLQQLLALKNRVLMALQQHGIGKPVPVAGAPAGTQGNAAAGGAAPGANGAQPEVSPITLGGVAAVMLAFVALVVRVLMRKRRKPVPEARESAVEPPAATRPTGREDAPAEPAAPVAPAAPAAPLATGAAPAVVKAKAEESAEESAEEPPRDAAQEHGEHAEPGDEAPSPQELAELPTLGETIEPAHQPETPHHAEADIDETSAAAPEASRAEPRPIELTMPGAHPEPHAHTAEAQAPAAPAESAAPPLHELAMPGDHSTPAVPSEQQAEVAMPHVEVPQEFPKSAVDALGGLDMPLPPRVETPEPMPGVPLSTEPVATPETTARQALPFGQPPVPPAGEAIEVGIAGAGSIAGLGAPRFGPLTLDFDLNLPADSAEPLPVFTPEQLSRIARNKLDLAHEYIALGDLAGARSLINEVIESNDHATRADAQALLSTLSPLS